MLGWTHQKKKLAWQEHEFFIACDIVTGFIMANDMHQLQVASRK